jgi:hypothetical protein
MRKYARESLTVVLVVCAVLLSLMTVFVQVKSLGRAYLLGEQVLRHEAVIKGMADAPYQYRVLSDYLVEGWRLLFQQYGLPQPTLSAFIGFRVLQNFVLFLLAAFYYQALGLRLYPRLLGLMLLAWGMTHALYDSDLAFNTYSDSIFYLAAALAILRQRDWLIVPLIVLAAFNRETSGLIPLLLLAARYKDIHQKRANAKTSALIVVLSLTAYVLIFVGLRQGFGPHPFALPYGRHPGLELLWYNLGRPITWVQLFATFGLLPGLAFMARRHWPPALTAFCWTLVPAWVGLHLLFGVIAETRLLLVPLALIVVPGTLAGLMPRRSPRPDQATASS